MSNRTRAGSRKARYRSGGVGWGRVPPEKISWLRTYPSGQVSLHAYDPSESVEELELEMGSEEGVNYVLLMPVPGRYKPLAWNLSSMTYDELEATRQFFNNLFDLAEPVCRQRDKVASDAEAQGDYSYARIYRDVPQFIVRERQVRKNSQSVHDGSQGSDEGSRDGLDSSGGVRGDSNELADGDPSDSLAQDDEPQAD